MRYYGDIPIDHRELSEELVQLELWLNERIKEFPILDVAKGMVCISHDYYSMEMEEEGDRLINIAEKHCPGYFKGPIYVHMEKDETFEYLVSKLRKSLAAELMATYGFV